MNYKLILKYFWDAQAIFVANLESSKFFPMMKQKVFGISEFLGSIGGLIGLLAGISVISLVESAFGLFIVTITKFHQFKKLSKISIETHLDASQNRMFLVNHEHVLYQCSGYVRQFAESSTIHGINHIANINKQLIERIFWTMIAAISSALCVILIFDTTKHAELNPIEFGIDEKIWSLNEESLKCLLFERTQKKQ